LHPSNNRQLNSNKHVILLIRIL